jgi:hypothetical protein
VQPLGDAPWADPVGELLAGAVPVDPLEEPRARATCSGLSSSGSIAVLKRLASSIVRASSGSSVGSGGPCATVSVFIVVSFVAKGE